MQIEMIRTVLVENPIRYICQFNFIACMHAWPTMGCFGHWWNFQQAWLLDPDFTMTIHDYPFMNIVE